MKKIQKDAKTAEAKIKTKADLRAEKAEFIKKHLERLRAEEDAQLEHIMQEQEVIDDLRQYSDDSMWEIEESRKYNQEFQEHVNMQVYRVHGISKDKLIGMEEYKNALYRGGAVVIFILSLAVTMLSGIVHGFQSEICILMLAYTAVEGALLPKEIKRWQVLEIICRVCYILAFLVMIIMLVCFEIEYSVFTLLLPYVIIIGAIATIVGTVSYFFYDPYGQDKKRIKAARKQLKDIEKTAEKEVRKKHKTQEKEEKKEERRREREEKKEQKRLEREEKKKLKAEKNAKFWGNFKKDKKNSGESTEVNDNQSGKKEETGSNDIGTAAAATAGTAIAINAAADSSNTVADNNSASDKTEATAENTSDADKANAKIIELTLTDEADESAAVNSSPETTASPTEEENKEAPPVPEADRTETPKKRGRKKREQIVG